MNNGIGKDKKNKKNKKNNIYYSLKFIIIGDALVGKTNIINVFKNGEFYNEYKLSIGMDFLSCNVKIYDKIFQLNLWDTAGSESYRSITKGYYNNSTCAIVVYDISEKKSFDSVRGWINECKNYTNDKIHLVLVGNKQDLNERREVSYIEGKALADEYGMVFFESSALTGYNINEIFYDSCRQINEKIEKNFYDLEDSSDLIKINKIITGITINKEIENPFSGNQILGNISFSSKKNGKKKCDC